MKKRILVLVAIMFVLSVNMHAQVTIGSVNAPKAGAILDLNSGAKGGLVLSNVGIDHPTEIPAGFPGVTPGNTDAAKAGLKGAMIYNTNANTCIGVHAWNGDYWERIAPSLVMAPGTTLTSSNAAIAFGGDVINFTASFPEAKTYRWYASESDKPYEYLGMTTTNTYSKAFPTGKWKVKTIMDDCHVPAESNELAFAPTSISPYFGSTDGGNTIYIYGDFPYASTDDYVQDGLVAHFDGINNTGEGDKYHSTSVVGWKNLSNTGTLPDAEMCLTKDCATQSLNSEFKWTGNSFSFGEYTAMTDTWLRINKPNYTPANMQVEVTFKHRPEWTVLKGSTVLLGCFESGGFGIVEYFESLPLAFRLWTLAPTSGYKFAGASGDIYSDVIYTASAGVLSNATTCTQYIALNGAISENPIDNSACQIGLALVNTVWAIGANPAGAGKVDGILHDTDLYSLRLYNRSLSAEELAQNAAADQVRYQNPPTVTIGGEPCTEVAVLSPNFLKCKVPASKSGTGHRDVVITTSINTLTLTDAYEYVNAASAFYVSSIAPIIGSAGNPLTLTGNNLDQITEVKLGGVSCDDFVTTPTNCTFTIPPLSPGALKEVDITITINNSQTYRFAKVFEYK